MRLNKLILIVITSLVIFNCNAAEPILEPHAMLYFEIPLGSNYKDHAKPAFGFRMDTALVEPGKPIDYPKLFSHPAMLDLRMGRAGVEELKFSGVDFLKQIHTLHADGDGADAPADNAGAADEGTTTGEQGEAGTVEKAGVFSKLPDVSGAIKKTQYMGLAIGVAIGFVILTNNW